jgi:hypothetical protein
VSLQDPQFVIFVVCVYAHDSSVNRRTGKRGFTASQEGPDGHR